MNSVLTPAPELQALRKKAQMAAFLTVALSLCAATPLRSSEALPILKVIAWVVAIVYTRTPSKLMGLSTHIYILHLVYSQMIIKSSSRML